MEKECDICRSTAKYKCPKCYIYYCSVSCCKAHKNDNCEVKNSFTNQEGENNEGKNKEIRGRSTVPIEKLQLLDNDEELKNLLANKHLRDLLSVIDKAENAEEIMQKAMQEPIFVEFADACLKVVDPQSVDEN